MSKQYIGSQEHWEDEVNAYYDELEERNRQQEKEINDQMYKQMENDLRSEQENHNNPPHHDTPTDD